MVSGRVSHACQACAKARVKCEETKPCSRCRARSLVCRPHVPVLPRQHPPPLVSPYSSAYVGLQPPPMDSGNRLIIPGVADTAVAFQGAYPAQFPTSDGNPTGAASQTPMTFSSSGYGDHVAILDHVSIGSAPVTDAALVSNANSAPETYGGHGETSSMEYYHTHSSSGITLGHTAAPGFDIRPDLASSQRTVGNGIIRIEQEGYTACVEGTGHNNTEFDDSVSTASRMRQFASANMWQTNPPANIRQGGSHEANCGIWRLSDDHSRQASTIDDPRESLLASISNSGLISDAGHVFSQGLTPDSRDNMLAAVLRASASDPSETIRAASAFPPIDVLEDLIHVFLASHKHQECQWIDVGANFRLNSQRPEWLASVAAAGTAIVADSSVQQFRQVFDEPIRAAVSTIPARKTNNSDLDLGLLQAMVLFQDIGLWSSDLLAMEITQGYLSIPITMIRSRGLFQHSMYPIVALHFSENGAELELKRSQWVEQESWKRLVFHCYLRDAQVSIARQIPPQISSVELTLPLPESRSVWQAPNADEWTGQYMEDTVGRQRATRKRLPTLTDLFRDVSLLAAFQNMLDVPFAASIYLHGFWSIIWQLQQLNAVRQPGGGVGDLDKTYGSMSIFPTQPENQSYYLPYSPYSSYMPTSPQEPLYSSRRPSTSATSGSSSRSFPSLLKSRQQELVEQLQQFRQVLHGWYEFSAQEELMLNLLQLHLHISLYDLQLFSEGENKASGGGFGMDGDGSSAEGTMGHRVGDARDSIRTDSIHSRYDGIDQGLHEWSSGINGRQAAWHAGQILSRFRQGIPASHERTFYAVALQQAALAMWAWGVSQQAAAVSVSQTAPSGSADEAHYVYAFVDGVESLAVRQFIQFGQGEPVIRGTAQESSAGSASSSGPAAEAVVRLNEPQACMGVVLSVLRAAYGAGQEIDSTASMPPLVKSLYRRIEQLRAAASAIGVV